MNRHDLRDLGGGAVTGLLAARAADAPDNLALEFEDQAFTYRQLNDAVNAATGGLLALGLGREDAVSVFMTNRPEAIVAASAVARAGLVTVPVNTAYKGGFLHYALDHSESKVIVTEAALAEALMSMETLPPALRAIVYVDGVPDAVPAGDILALSWEAMIAGAAPAPVFPALQPDDTASISFTSGTTGRSKGVVSPHLAGAVMARETAHAFELTTRDRLYTCMPLFHGMAAITTVAAAFYAGATVILSRRFSVTRFWDEVRESRATQFNALGSILHMLMSRPPSPQDRTHCVTRVFAAPAPADVLYRFEARFGVHVIEGYGQTEIKNVMYNPLHGRRVGSLGKPTPSSIIEIHDEQGNALPCGMVGEIVYRPRGANIMMKHYYRNPEATLANMRGMWWHTGDLGSMDAEGFFYFHDRKSDALRRRGENISSQELEAALNAFPGVSESAAVAVRSDIGEDEVLVVLQAANPQALDLAALFGHCAQVLPRFMVPRYFRVVEDLPRTPTGKVRKAALREEGLAAGTWDATAMGHSVPR